ncbi:BTB/POZ domain-containing protein KCTD17 [Aphelenchoides avenae]|nr:BTB/POZ domain-containing protein KCTD17 [Aphelenchus avenae]
METNTTEAAPSSSRSGGTNPSGDWVRLNVGGQVFQTTRQTLRSEPGSFLARLCEDDDNLPSSVDESGAYLVDRDPHHFRTILNYLRNGSLWLEKTYNIEELLQEAEFYNLTRLIGLVKETQKKTYSAEAIIVSRNSLEHCTTISVGETYADEHFLITELKRRMNPLRSWDDRNGVYVIDDNETRFPHAAFDALLAHIMTVLYRSGFRREKSSAETQWIFTRGAGNQE